MSVFDILVTDIKKCTLCEQHLEHGVNPVFQVDPSAKILIAGQAPGLKVHQTGIPFDDASGNRLREWLGLSNKQFYDPKIIAIVPMGFCYLGRGKSGDLAPRAECETTWRKQLLNELSNIQLTLVLGQYAQAYHFGSKHHSVTELVMSWKEYWPTMVPLPHPSPRNNVWLHKNTWFENEILPVLRKRVLAIVTE